MLKIILLISFNLTTFASDIIEKLIKMEPAPQVKQIYVTPKKFIVTEEFSNKKPFRGVLKKGSIIQDLNGDNFYTAKNNIVLNAVEVSVSSPYVYLLGANDKPVLVCFSTDINNIDRVVKLDYDHIPFTKEKYKYRTVDFDQYYIFDTYLTMGSHSYDLSKTSQNNHQSFGLNLEAGFKKQKFVPFKITFSLNQLTGDVLSWNYLNMGLKVFKQWNKKNSIYSLSLEAQRTLISSATVVNEAARLYENRFSLGLTYQYEQFLASFEIAKERILFPAEINFTQLALEDDTSYQSSILFKVGYSFEKLL